MHIRQRLDDSFNRITSKYCSKPQTTFIYEAAVLCRSCLQHCTPALTLDGMMLPWCVISLRAQPKYKTWLEDKHLKINPSDWESAWLWCARQRIRRPRIPNCKYLQALRSCSGYILKIAKKRSFSEQLDQLIHKSIIHGIWLFVGTSRNKLLQWTSSHSSSTPCHSLFLNGISQRLLNSCPQKPCTWHKIL